jgi:hypothetical protein
MRARPRAPAPAPAQAARRSLLALLATTAALAIAASALAPPPAASAIARPRFADAAAPLGDAPPPPPPPPRPTPPAPSLQLAARQRLLDYAVSRALDALDARARALTLPDYEASLRVPLVGAVDLAARRLNVTRLSVPRTGDDGGGGGGGGGGGARVSIDAGFFHATASNCTVAVEFEWEWRSGRLSGRGTAELALEGGALDDVFAVRNARRPLRKKGRRRVRGEGEGGGEEEEEEEEEEGGGGGDNHRDDDDAGQEKERGGGGGGRGSVPQIVTVSSALNFDAVRLTVHSESTDWLYQALLYLFGRAARASVEAALGRALAEDVPALANAALATLPTSAAIGQGGGALPLEAVFTFAVYTLNYVLVSGYTQVGGGGGGGDDAGAGGGDAGPPPPPPLGPCPFDEPTPQPLTPAQIGADPAMATLYVHDAALSCLSWAAHATGAMPRTLAVADGTIPGVPRLLADVFGALVPSLPVWYRGRSLRLDVEVLEAPRVRFLADGTAEVAVRYATNVTVLPRPARAAAAAGGGPFSAPDPPPPRPLPSAGDPRGEALVAVLDANLTAIVKPGWEATTVVSARASYGAVASSLPVDLLGWQAAAEWAARAASAGPARSARLGLRALWDAGAATPVRPWFAVTAGSARVAVLDRWAALSADVEVVVPPPPPPPPGDAPETRAGPPLVAAVLM